MRYKRIEMENVNRYKLEVEIEKLRQKGYRRYNSPFMSIKNNKPILCQMMVKEL